MKRLIICLAAILVASIGLAQDKTATKRSKRQGELQHRPRDRQLLEEREHGGQYRHALEGVERWSERRQASLDGGAGQGNDDSLPKGNDGKTGGANKEAGDKNAADGEKFLAENKKKEGVKTTASGLQYKVLKEGTGESPKETDTVVTNYKGTLLDGTEFDSSYKRNEPATFPVNRVIKGWTEALQLMKPGAKYQLFIPSALAYGERGVGKDIGPNSTLIFEVELLSIKPPEPAADTAASGRGKQAFHAGSRCASGAVKRTPTGGEGTRYACSALATPQKK